MDRFPHRCTIERQTKTNTKGEVSATWTENATGVRCWIQEKQGQLKFGESGAGLEYEAILFLKPGTDIKPQTADDVKDRIQITKPTRFGAAYFLVQHVADESGTEDHLVAFLKRTKGAD